MNKELAPLEALNYLEDIAYGRKKASRTKKPT